jgi:tetratricopeptide (TPR) repeat protein
VIATTFNNIGQVLIARKEYQQAIAYLDRAMQIRREWLGADSADTAWTAYHTGLALSNLNDPQRALHIYKVFLRNQSETFNKIRRDFTFNLADRIRCFVDYSLTFQSVGLQYSGI